MDKPFVYGIAVSGDNFTDRKKETKRLKMNFESGVNSILISPRRMGKTSIVGGEDYENEPCERFGGNSVY